MELSTGVWFHKLIVESNIYLLIACGTRLHVDAVSQNRAQDRLWHRSISSSFETVSVKRVAKPSRDTNELS